MHPNHPAHAHAGTGAIPLDHTLPAHLRGSGVPAELLRRASGRPLPEPCRHPVMRRAAMTLLGSLWQALLTDFRAGIRIRRGSRRRVVRFLRSVAYLVDGEQGTVAALAVLADGRRQPITVSIGEPLVTWDWIHTALERHRELLEACRPEVTAEVMTLPDKGAPLRYAVQARLLWIWTWAKDCIHALVRRHVDWRELRRRIAGALALDPASLDLARRTMRPNRRHPLSNRSYNDCLRHRHQIERVAKLAPALFPALGWMISERQIEPEARAFSVLKQRLREEGASAVDWRRLLADPARPVWRLYRSDRMSKQPGPLGTLALWAQVHRGLGPNDRLPDALWLSILRTGAEPLNDRLGEIASWDMPPALLAAGLARAREAIAQGGFPAFVEREWLPVLTGFAYEEPFRLSTRFRSWPRAVQRALECEQLALARLRSAGETPWPVPVEAWAQDGFEARFLCSEADLVGEGIAMRHCAAALIGECREGKLLIGSIRDRASGRRLATVGFRRASPTDPWSLHDVKAFANQTVPNAVRGFAQDLARAVAKLPAPASAGPTPEPRPAGTSESTVPTPTFLVLRRDRQDFLHAPDPSPAAGLAEDPQLPEDPHRRAPFQLLRWIFDKGVEVPPTVAITIIESPEDPTRFDGVRCEGPVRDLNAALGDARIYAVVLEEDWEEPDPDRLMAMLFGMDSAEFMAWADAEVMAYLDELRQRNVTSETNASPSPPRIPAKSRREHDVWFKCRTRGACVHHQIGSSPHDPREHHGG